MQHTASTITRSVVPLYEQPIGRGPLRYCINPGYGFIMDKVFEEEDVTPADSSRGRPTALLQALPKLRPTLPLI